MKPEINKALQDLEALTTRPEFKAMAITFLRAKDLKMTPENIQYMYTI